MKILSSFALCAALVGWCAACDAAPIKYNTTLGETLGFGHGFLTNTSTEIFSHPGYWVGDVLANMTGDLYGDITATTFTISPSTLTLAGVGMAPVGNDIWTLELTGGSLTVPPSAFTNTGTLLGTMDYVIRDASNAIYDTGSFYVIDTNFAGYANNVSDSGIYIWANNWNNLTTDKDTFINNGGIPLGIDLGGLGEYMPVPEPSQWILALTGLATLISWSRVRRGR